MKKNIKNLEFHDKIENELEKDFFNKIKKLNDIALEGGEITLSMNYHHFYKEEVS